ncbi:hypothetical protein SERLA73DRAFT_73120 [Serpula lacrymans var. lacrymans S7.3]|uniref:Uncharacterized protein n=2 Tax=Serpula lacrymans var. lacrymans TaxID=341189 RepID=F8PU86_SERL3|nr:uncharacterized protein SERLADRAFT_437683 [Serpula lacrymans var. lacrymans S7.9]EGO00399.1 hypothetical protein SERLA73DRAFT_73120 [Serpula lacrymans var. lacrymans S7.3]EGO25958.1 hypothetical protein SERLADRAFT_437683 [Serpula lacrymans var. lacrymans S7.9]
MLVDKIHPVTFAAYESRAYTDSRAAPCCAAPSPSRRQPILILDDGDEPFHRQPSADDIDAPKRPQRRREYRPLLQSSLPTLKPVNTTSSRTTFLQFSYTFGPLAARICCIPSFEYLA